MAYKLAARSVGPTGVWGRPREWIEERGEWGQGGGLMEYWIR